MSFDQCVFMRATDCELQDIDKQVDPNTWARYIQIHPYATIVNQHVLHFKVSLLKNVSE